MTQPSPRLLDLLRARSVVDLPAIREALGDVTEMTAFRHLRTVRYRRSYNHNGRYYALFEPSRYDSSGLWSWRGIHFSVDGSLVATVRRLVRTAEGGATQSELRERLRVRVHNALLGLVRAEELARERLGTVYLYVDVHPDRRAAQLAHRRAELALPDGAVSDSGVIEVLLVLIRHPGAGASEVARRLRSRSPPIGAAQVEAVFTRYGLREKGGPST